MGTIGKGIGKAVLWGAKETVIGTGSAILGLGKIGLKAAIGTAGVGLDATKTVAKGAVKSTTYNNGSKNFLGMFAKDVNDIGKKLFKYELPTKKFNPLTGELEEKLGGIAPTKLGLGVIGGIMAVGAANDYQSAYRESRIGQIDPKTRTATPDYTPREYTTGPVNNGGATGDLVFALHNNRRG